MSVFVHAELPKVEDSDVKLKNNSLFINTKSPEQNKLYYFGLDHAVDSYDTDPDIFVGQYRGLDNPRAIEDGKCSRTNATKNPIAVLQRNITLGANTNSEFLVIAGEQKIDMSESGFGVAKSIAVRRAEATLGKYRRVHTAENALDEVKKFWEEIESRIKVNSPDDALNTTQNIWTKYQIINNLWRNKDIYYTKDAARKIGFIASLIPETAKEKLLSISSKQLKDGRLINYVEDNYFSVSDKVEEPAWLINATANYINETGEIEILKEQIPYFDSGKSSLIEHLIRASKHCVSSLNDKDLIEQDGVESNELSSLVYEALKNFVPLLEYSKEHYLVKSYQKTIKNMEESFNRRFWDGKWFLVGRNHKRIGSRKNLHRKIDLNAQALSASVGLSHKEKAEKSMSNAWHHLNSPAGLTNFTPPYIKYSEDIPDSASAPGEKNNGGIFIFSAAYALLAETTIGRGDLAYKIFQEHSPIYRSSNQDTYKIEPYYYPDYMYGPSSLMHGAGSSVCDNNACGQIWLHIMEGMLGIRPVLGGLKIDPTIPRDWRQVELSRVFRGAEYHIRILNPTRQTKGVDRIVVDGLRLTGNTIKPFKTGAHFVEVFIG